MNPLSPEIVEAIRGLAAEGRPYREIVKKLGVSMGAVSLVMRAGRGATTIPGVPVAAGAVPTPEEIVAIAAALRARRLKAKLDESSRRDRRSGIRTIRCDRRVNGERVMV